PGSPPPPTGCRSIRPRASWRTRSRCVSRSSRAPCHWATLPASQRRSEQQCWLGSTMALPTELTSRQCAHRGAVLHFRSDPGMHDEAGSFEYLEDGLLVTRDGRVAAVGPARELLSSLPTDMPVVGHTDSLLMPGFVDTHIHYPQTDIIGSGGRGL